MNNQGDGLSLEMTSYYNEYARFEIKDQQVVDDAASAQRQERRMKITVLVNAFEIRQRILPVIVTTEAYIGAGSADDDLAYEEEFTNPS